MNDPNNYQPEKINSQNEYDSRIKLLKKFVEKTFFNKIVISMIEILILFLSLIIKFSRPLKIQKFKIL